MVIATLLICFLLNVINHRNILVGVLNTLLLLLSILFYLRFSRKKLSSIKSLSSISPILFLIAAIPLFTYNHSILTILLTVGIYLLLLLCFTYRFKGVLFPTLLLYILFVSFYVNGLIKLPVVFQPDQFIFSNDWNNLYISQMQREALYIPYKVRLLVFNGFVYFYVLLAKIANFYMLKNFYDILLIANLYPLVKGVILDLKSWDRSKTFLVLCMLLISSIVASSRTVNIFDAFMLLSPFLMYLILRGLNTVNKIAYIALFIFSLVIVTSPYNH